jgi:hypothetical protein
MKFLPSQQSLSHFSCDIPFHLLFYYSFLLFLTVRSQNLRRNVNHFFFSKTPSLTSTAQPPANIHAWKWHTRPSVWYVPAVFFLSSGFMFWKGLRWETWVLGKEKLIYVMVNLCMGIRWVFRFIYNKYSTPGNVPLIWGTSNEKLIHSFALKIC